jgi:hypothetical protein
VSEIIRESVRRLLREIETTGSINLKIWHIFSQQLIK